VGAPILGCGNCLEKQSSTHKGRSGNCRNRSGRGTGIFFVLLEVNGTDAVDRTTIQNAFNATVGRLVEPVGPAKVSAVQVLTVEMKLIIWSTNCSYWPSLKDTGSSVRFHQTTSEQGGGRQTTIVMAAGSTVRDEHVRELKSSSERMRLLEVVSASFRSSPPTDRKPTDWHSCTLFSITPCHPFNKSSKMGFASAAPG
jgi:hypothetical protein